MSGQFSRSRVCRFLRSLSAESSVTPVLLSERYSSRGAAESAEMSVSFAL